MNAMSQHLRKQITIGGITLGVVATIVVGVFIARQVTDESNHVLIRYADEDSVRQNETQGIVALTTVEEHQFEESGGYQLIALLRNPNSAWHASHVSYQFLVEGENEKKKVIEGSSFIGAGSKRLLIDSFSDEDFAVKSVSFTVESVDWVDATNRELPVPRVRQAVFEKINSSTSRVTGQAVNDSELGIADIEIGVLVRNQGGETLAGGLVAVDSLGAGESKEVEYMWKKGLDGVSELSFFPIAESVSRPSN